MTSYETEVKIYLGKSRNIPDILEEKGAQLIRERTYERNVRYDVPDKSLTSRGVVIRLREDDSVKLTYKEPGVIERGIITREELEVEISDFDVMQAILAKFGYTPSMFYEKHRTIYALHDTQIMVDELPYGNFIEVEGDAKDIEWVLEKIDLHKAERRGDSYSKLFDYVKHHLDLEFRDLSFDNFEGIDVPESAFVAPGSIVIR